MAHQSLYRRYRSQNFAQVLGQPHVTSALRDAIANGRESHAYLFSGPRGTGKTSTARILAKALNCDNLSGGEPCTTCESCVAIQDGRSFDLHELDAASHNKVDDVRDLISKVQLGSPGRTKVYILDEVHMLSSGAENALLKTLEEPPEHVVFVLATTEPQKVVPTIRSRTQHHEFRLLPAEVLAEHVRWVIEDAGLDVDDEAIDYVLRQGGGSARDTLSALDMVASAGGIPEGNDIAEALLRTVGDHDPGRAVATIQEGLALGREPRTMGEDLLELARNAFLASMGAPLVHLNDRMEDLATELAQALGPAALTRTLEAVGQALVEMRQAADPRVPFEVTLLRLTRDPSAPSPTSAPAPTPAAEGGTAAPGTASGADEARVAALEARVAELENRLTEALASMATQPAATTDHGATPGGDRRPTPSRSAAPRPSRTPRRPPTANRPPADGAPDNARNPGPDPAATGEPAPAPAPADGATGDAGPAPEAPGPVAAGAPITVAAMTSAFATQLDELSQKVRVRFKGGRILAVDGATVRFGVPNAIHRDRCADVGDEVETALSAHFGQPVTLEVVVDDNSVAPIDPAKLEPSTPAAPPPEDDPDDIGPVEDLADASDQASGGVDRLTKAFPGSKVIDQSGH